MSETEIDRLRRRLDESPEDPEAWVCLARALARETRPPPPLDPQLLPQLLAALRTSPHERPLVPLLCSVTCLRQPEAPLPLDVPLASGSPCHPGQALPLIWQDLEERLVTDAGPSYDRLTGLPLEMLDWDGTELVLVPEMVVGASFAGAEEDTSPATDHHLSPGYLVRSLGQRGLSGMPDPGAVPLRGVLGPGDLARALVELQSQLPDWGRLLPSDGEIRPLTALLGRRLAHGLVPEDCCPPPPSRPLPEIGMPRLSGAAPSPRIFPTLPTGDDGETLRERIRRWLGI